MGAHAILDEGLPEGNDAETCDALMDETQEALTVDLSFPAAYDLRPALAAVQQQGFLLNGQQLQGVRSTLEAAYAVRERLLHPLSPDGTPPYPALARLAAGIDPQDRQLLGIIQQCIQMGEVRDAASDKLAEVRRERRANLAQLREVVEAAAAAMKLVGASEEGTTSIIRDRFCVGVKTGRQGELGRGAMRLSSSASGATVYVEPPAAVALNNSEALLKEREDTEVATVLAMLTGVVRQRAASLDSLVASIAALDVAAARAKHARWLGATRPALRRGSDTSTSASAAAPSPTGGEAAEAGRREGCKLYAPGARHPVLMQPALSTLPYPPSAQDFRFDRNFQEAPAWERTSPSAPTPSSRGPMEPARLPRPLDLRIPADKQVVAITGPNTGGKTATLKTLGALALMSRAGLFWPCDPAATQQHGQPYAAYFDRVLADLGDSQSLQQNLSTFSGHIRRIKQILHSTTPRSLVLLDEVGSGTDPVEGAALARAVLDALARRAALTVATTHHAELRHIPEEDGAYCNVSMEFDAATLRPTYRLLWGEAGASSALDIALSLGFDSQVVAEARRVVAKGQEALAVGGSTQEVIARLNEQLEATQAAARRAREAAKVAQVHAEMLKEERRRLQQKKDKLKGWEVALNRDKARIGRELDVAVQQFAAGLISQKQVQEAFRKSNEEVLKLL